jgi:hypothetical protein
MAKVRKQVQRWPVPGQVGAWQPCVSGDVKAALKYGFVT